MRAKARRIVKEAEETSWKNFVSNINMKTTTQEIWKNIKKIKGETSSSIPGILKDDEWVTDPQNIANLFADSLEEDSYLSLGDIDDDRDEEMEYV